MTPRSTDATSLAAEIERIQSLGLDALRAEWQTAFGAGPPQGLTKDVVARTLAQRLQEQVFGGLDRETRRLLDRLARDDKPTVELNRFKSGTVLVREYQGERHTVTVVPDGFLWQGTTYPSLSTIARAITGTPWNGPRFFGLRAGSKDGRTNGSVQSDAVVNSGVDPRPGRRQWQLYRARGG